LIERGFPGLRDVEGFHRVRLTNFSRESKLKMIGARFQRPLRARPIELAAGIGRQFDIGRELGGALLQMNANFAAWMRHAGVHRCKVSQIWRNSNLLESGSSRFNSRNGAEKFEVRAGSPRVAIRARI